MFMIATSSQIVTSESQSSSQKSDEPTASGTSQEDGAEQVVHAELSDNFAVNPTGAPSQPADDACDSDGIELTVTAERAAVRIARSRAESEHLYV